MSARLENAPEVVSGLRESKEATGNGLSGRSVKVDPPLKSAWKS